MFRLLASLSAAIALTWAAPVSAALRLATYEGVAGSVEGAAPAYGSSDPFTGSHGGAFGIAGNLDGYAVTMRFLYDTARGGRVGAYPEYAYGMYGAPESPFLDATIEINGVVVRFPTNGYDELGYLPHIGFLATIDPGSFHGWLAAEFNGPNVPTTLAATTGRIAGTGLGLFYGHNLWGGVSIRSLTISAVPEPGTWAMMIFGLGAAGVMLRSARRKVALAAA